MARRCDIPGLFHSEYEGQPFQTCAVCACEFGPEVIYSISKTCNQGEAIVEVAVCESCGENLRGEMSEESLQAVQTFVESRLVTAALSGQQADTSSEADMLQAILAPPDDAPEDPLEMLASCSLCGKKQDACRTFSISAYCVGDEMVVQSSGAISLGMPAMICDDCNTEVSEKLSQQTRDSWQQFFDEFIDTPPQISFDGPIPILGI